jgi:hypothetical protein
MSQGSSKEIPSSNNLTDSDNESQINVIRQRNRRAIYSTSESEAEQIESHNNNSEVWTSKTFVPKIYKFAVAGSGIKRNVNRSAKILDFFQLLFSEELVELIARETNRYWSRKNNNNVNMSDETGPTELYFFFAVSLLMTRNKKLSLAEYWSKDKPLRSDIFGELMTRDDVISNYCKCYISPMMLVALMIVCTKYETLLKYYEKHLMNHFSLTNGYALTKVCCCIKGGFLLSNTYHQKETDLV